MVTSKNSSSLKNLTKEIPTKDEFLDALLELHTQDDRVVAIVMPSYLETVLEMRILSRMVYLSSSDYEDLFNGTAPLATFSSKIRIGYALGIYGAKTRAALNKIREIRNAFSHAKKQIRFDTLEVKNVCLSLSYIDEMKEDDILGILSNEEFSIPRNRFIQTTFRLFSDLILLEKGRGPFRPKKPLLP